MTRISPYTDILRGNCYVASEALWHITGGQKGPYKVMRMRLPDGERHWFLKHKTTGEVLDPSRLQFGENLPDYSKAKGAGFLTREPSLRASELMARLTYQGEK